MLSFPFIRQKKTALLGIDISASSVKLLELNQVNGTLQVQGIALEPLAEGAIVDSDIIKPDAITAAVAQVINTSGTTLRHAAIAIPDAIVITRIIPMKTDLKDQHREKLILQEAYQYIPYAVDNISLDFDVIGPSLKDPDTVDVLLVASRKQSVDARVDAVTAAGITVNIVDLESQAVARTYRLLLQTRDITDSKAVTGIIDMGATTTTVTLLQHQSAIFSRTEFFGGRQLTDEIQQQYQLSWQEAEQAKKKKELLDNDYPAAFHSFKQIALIHIRRCLQLFYSARHYLEIEHLLLAGGSANISGFADYLQQQLGIPLTIADPFRDMPLLSSVNAAETPINSAALVTGCGLALRGFER